MQLTSEDMDLIPTAYELSLETVEELQICAWGEIKTKDPDEKEEYIFKVVTDKEVSIYYATPSLVGYVESKFSLSRFAHNTISQLKALFDNESVLHESVKEKIQGLEMLDILNIERNEIGEWIREHTKMLLHEFVSHISMVAQSTVDESVGNAWIMHFQNVIKAEMRDHWKELGLPRDFSLIAKSEIAGHRKFFGNRWRWLSGETKYLLDLSTLANEAQKLLSLYQEAKATYISSKKSFFNRNRKGRIEDWRRQWTEAASSEFPTLSLPILESLIEAQETKPYEMMVLHLSQKYNYHEDRIRRKITESRKLRRCSE